METLVKFLLKRIPYTIALLLGLILPGTLIVFFFERELFLELEILKLLLIIASVPSVIYIYNIVIYILAFRKKAEKDIKTSIIDAALLAYCEMILIVIIKIYFSDFFKVQCAIILIVGSGLMAITIIKLIRAAKAQGKK